MLQEHSQVDDSSREHCRISASKIDGQKTSVAGRLALLTEKIIGNNPRIAYRAIPGVIKATVGSHVAVPSYKAFENFLKANGFIHQKLAIKPI